ncbi:MAG: hypothetical protein JSR59_23290 [Proteobacteria bacterium]|nr:hypothetical protein [Pseudomonadota bacterium]
MHRSSVCAAAAMMLACLHVASSPACAAGPGVPMLYDLVVETGMPHLEENLRYAVTRERRCVDPRDLGRMFPVLDHVALQDCRLVPASQADDHATYTLACSGGHGTTGEARWQFDEHALAGTLDVRFGGKNMTFYQRISGRMLGRCEAP